MKRHLAMLVALVMIASMFVACGQSEPQQKTDPAPTAAEASAATEKTQQPAVTAPVTSGQLMKLPTG